MGEARFRTAGPTVFSRIGDWVLFVGLAAGVAAVVTPGEGRPQRREKQTAAVG